MSSGRVVLPHLDAVSQCESASGRVRDQLREIADSLLSAPFRAVGPKEFDRVMEEIIIDSLSPLFLNLLTDISGRVIDIGCGPGIPILPLAAMSPEIKFLGIDSSTKRIGFARSLAVKLELKNASFHIMRLSQGFWLNTGRENVGAIISRGTADISTVHSFAQGNLSDDGSLIIYSTRKIWDEMKRPLEGWVSEFYPYYRPSSDREYGLIVSRETIGRKQ